jgi:hypothetical protein
MSEKKQKICTILGVDTTDEAKKLITNQLFQQRAPLKGHVETVISLCEQYNLNPMLREIYIRFGEGSDIYPTLTVDGWYNLVNSHPECNGYEFFESKDEKVLVPQHPTQPNRHRQHAYTAIGCKLYRKGREHAPIIWEYLYEVFIPNNEVYYTHPNRMLRHRSFIQAARVVFNLSGVYDADEVDQILAKPKEAKSEDSQSSQSTLMASSTVEEELDFDVVKPGDVVEEQPTSKPEVEATQNIAEQSTNEEAVKAIAAPSKETLLDDATRQQVTDRLKSAARGNQLEGCVKFLLQKLPQHTSEIELIAKELSLSLEGV